MDDELHIPDTLEPGDLAKLQPRARALLLRRLENIQRAAEEAMEASGYSERGADPRFLQIQLQAAKEARGLLGLDKPAPQVPEPVDPGMLVRDHRAAVAAELDRVEQAREG